MIIWQVVVIVIVKQNYSRSTLPVPRILAQFAFGVIIIHTHINNRVLLSLPHHVLDLLTFFGAADDVHLIIYYVPVLVVVRTVIVWC